MEDNEITDNRNWMQFITSSTFSEFSQPLPAITNLIDPALMIPAAPLSLLVTVFDWIDAAEISASAYNKLQVLGSWYKLHFETFKKVNKIVIIEQSIPKRKKSYDENLDYNWPGWANTRVFLQPYTIVMLTIMIRSGPKIIIRRVQIICRTLGLHLP